MENTRKEDAVEIDLGRLFAALWRGRYRMILAAVLAGVLTLAGLLLVRSKFQTPVLFYVNGVGTEAAMVLAETGETLDAVAAAAKESWSREALDGMLTAKLSDGNGYFTVTVTTENAAEGKRIADAVAQILPQRVEEVIPGAVLTVADGPALAEKASVPNRGKVALAGALTGAVLAAGEIGVRVIFGVGRKKRKKRTAGSGAR